MKDVLGNQGSFIGPNVLQPKGYLPRPCIMGDYGFQNNCAWDLSTNVDTLTVDDFDKQTLSDVYLPGMPPLNNCSNQGCPGFTCKISNYCT